MRATHTVLFPGLIKAARYLGSIYHFLWCWAKNVIKCGGEACSRGSSRSSRGSGSSVSVSSGSSRSINAPYCIVSRGVAITLIR